MKDLTLNEYGETVIRMIGSDLNPLTKEQIDMLQAASEKEYVYDEDCPPLDDEMLLKMEQDTMEKQKNIRKAT